MHHSNWDAIRCGSKFQVDMRRCLQRVTDHQETDPCMSRQSQQTIRLFHCRSHHRFDGSDGLLQRNPRGFREASRVSLEESVIAGCCFTACFDRPTIDAPRPDADEDQFTRHAEAPVVNGFSCAI